jgi:hypothetical protein
MIPNQEIIERVKERYGDDFIKVGDEANAVASVYQVKGYESKIGFISSMS